MKQKYRYFTSISLAFLMSLLTACSDGSRPPESDKKTGIFQNGRVAGLGYKTETLSGVTNDQGEYKYRAGETIAFYIGKIQLGNSVPVSAALSPVDLVDGVTLPETGIETRRFLRDFNKKLSPAIQLADLLSFMYTMDSDKNGSNGITIKKKLSDFFTVPYDRSKSADREKLATSIYAAAAAGAIANARIPYPFEVLNYYYADLGLVPQFYQYAKVEKEFVGHKTTEIYSYNSIGKVASMKYHFNDELQSITEYFYYDANGSLLAQQQNVDENNKAEITRYYNYQTLDINGNEIKEVRDNDGDGEADTVFTNTYDENDNLIRFTFDKNGDANEDHVTTYLYNEIGLRVSEQQDNDGDGVVDKITQHTYSTDGMSRSTVVRGSDNVVSSKRTSTYDASGNEIRVEVDSDGDGIVNTIFEYTYDARHNQVLSKVDTNIDGFFNETTKRIYGSDDNLLRLETRNSGGELNSVDVYVYDLNGNLTLFESYDSKGKIDTRIKSTYDENGNCIRKESDRNGDGKFELIESYEYELVPFFSFQLHYYN